MLCGLIHLVSKIKFWLKRDKGKMKCRSFCPACKYYNQCSKNTEVLEEIFGEAVDC